MNSSDGDIASDERSKRISDSHLIFPWTTPSIVAHPNEGNHDRTDGNTQLSLSDLHCLLLQNYGFLNYYFVDELKMTGNLVAEYDQDSAVKKASPSPYLLSAYRYNAGIYASIVAYHARLSELNSASDT